MNRAELVDLVLNNLPMDISMTKKDLTAVLTTTLDTIKVEVGKGEPLRLGEFGTFSRKVCKARTAYNPSTGEKLAVPAKPKVKFVPASAFKTSLRPVQESEVRSKSEIPRDDRMMKIEND